MHQKMMGHAGGNSVQSTGGLFPLLNRWAGVPWWLLILWVLPFFAGCTIFPQKNNIGSTIATVPVLDATDARSANFTLIGRVSVKGGKENFSGGVRWHHTETADLILLLSPLGQTLVQIQGNPDSVYLTTSEEENYYAADMESLTERVLGWRLPLMGLQFWIQGMNSPATASEIDMDTDGRIVTIRQDGWEISYLSYFPMLRTQTTQAHTAQPRLLMLKRGDLQMKLVIDNWDASNL
ncbi:MAG: lipoprotein insertase outer membrane protein LolB [Pseudomonadota bacterium]|nr:lipoprotein insertase outer membrane protein LolB [Pseudomonadota bacterium]